MAKKKVLVEAGDLSTEATKENVNKANAEQELTNAGVPELTEEQKQYARMTVRKEFNENFSKWATMTDDDATDEDIEAAKKDFESAINDTRTKQFELSDVERSLTTANLLKELNSKVFKWSNGQWKGVIMFDKVITEKIDELTKDSKKQLTVDYSTLMYLYAAMREPSGIGLEEAIAMSKYENYDFVNDKAIEEDSPVTYSGINEIIQRHVQWLSSNDKKLNILKERVNFAYAGIKMELKINELAEYLEFYDAINQRAIENNPDVQKATGDNK